MSQGRERQPTIAVAIPLWPTDLAQEGCLVAAEQTTTLPRTFFRTWSYLIFPFRALLSGE